MSRQEKAPEPPHNPAGRHPDQHPPTGGPWHIASPQQAASLPSPVPDQWATHRLVTIAARLNERRLNRQLSQLGLTLSALDALETAAEREPTTVTDLAALLCVSSQSLGKLLPRLQSLGFLTRERGRDGRSADIRLTQRGREVLAAAEDLLRAGAKAEAEDEALFRQQLEQHIRTLRDAEPDAAPQQVPPDQRSAAASAARYPHNPPQARHNEPGAKPWPPRTGQPEPKPTFRKQPRQ
ncbi:MarR family transcriptional regulator [[Micrococcus luteus] ATCC 49442]|uniref:MarR family winged helix-turn-helix transcriptional regulator n=1 Tax=[Micrococcus luteus] ATCC 49442 TaxID=2698727 RepID=UPI0013DC2843